MTIENIFHKYVISIYSHDISSLNLESPTVQLLDKFRCTEAVVVKK